MSYDLPSGQLGTKDFWKRFIEIDLGCFRFQFPLGFCSCYRMLITKIYRSFSFPYYYFDSFWNIDLRKILSLQPNKPISKEVIWSSKQFRMLTEMGFKVQVVFFSLFFKKYLFWFLNLKV